MQPALKSHTPNKAGRQKRGRMTFASDSDMKCISVISLFFYSKALAAAIFFKIIQNISTHYSESIILFAN